MEWNGTFTIINHPMLAVHMGAAHLRFGVLWILRTLMEWNGTEHMTVRNCSGYTNLKIGAARTQHVTRLIFT